MRTSSSHCLQSARLFSGLVLVMLSSGALAQPDQVPSAPPPAPILLHPQVAPAEAVGVGKDGNSPTMPFLAPSAGIATIAPIGGSQAVGATQAGESAALRSSLVLEQLLNDGKSVDALFDIGDLTPEVARYILSERVGAWGTVDGHWVDNIRRDLSLLVWREGGEALHKQAIAPRVLPRYLRLWLADSLGNIGDARCVPLCEGILSELKAQGPVRGDELEALTFQTIERIGRFYRDQGQYEEGAKAWLRLPPLLADQGRWQPDSMIEAARLYQVDGQVDKAKALYARVEQGDDEKLKGMAFYDQASLLIQEHPNQARDLILQKMPTIPEGADRVGPLWALAQAQWKLEAWPEAEEALQQTIKSCPVPPTSESQAVVLKAAKNRLATLQEWKDKSFGLPLTNLLARADDKGIYHATLYVHSLKPYIIRVRFDDDKLCLDALTKLRQQRIESGTLVTVYDMSFSVSHSEQFATALVFNESQNEDIQKIRVEIEQEDGEG